MSLALSRPASLSLFASWALLWLDVTAQNFQTAYTICSEQCGVAHRQDLDCPQLVSNMSQINGSCFCSDQQYLRAFARCVLVQCGPEELSTAAATTYDNCELGRTPMVMTEAEFIDSGTWKGGPVLGSEAKIAIIAGIISIVLVIPTTVAAILEIQRRRALRQPALRPGTRQSWYGHSPADGHIGPWTSSSTSLLSQSTLRMPERARLGGPS